MLGGGGAPPRPTGACRTLAPCLPLFTATTHPCPRLDPAFNDSLEKLGLVARSVQAVTAATPTLAGEQRWAGRVRGVLHAHVASLALAGTPPRRCPAHAVAAPPLPQPLPPCTTRAFLAWA